MLNIAVGQLRADADPGQNVLLIDDMASRAQQSGADLLLLPEGSLVRFVDDPGAPTRHAQQLDGEFVTGLLAASSTHQLAIAAGTFTPHEGRVRNTLVIIDRGEIRAIYHKIHLYDAFAFAESDTVEPGRQAPPVGEIAGVPVGFATCYDLRFPELFRLLTDRGAQVLAIASAWVAGPCKEEHWLTLLKARAIETTSYVVAADQTGHRTIGRSAAFDPMGLPLLDLGEAENAVGTVVVDPARIAKVRGVNPSLRNARCSVRLDSNS